MSSATQWDGDEWKIIGITCVGHALCHIGELAYTAVIAAVMVEFSLTADRAAALAVPGFVLFGVGAIPAGLWTDRRGGREVMTWYFGLLAAACLLVYFARSIWTLGCALTLLGAAISLYHPAGLTLLSHGCRNRGRAMGVNGVFGSLGVATGPALALFMLRQGSWRDAYVLIAVVSLAAAFLCRWLPAADQQPRAAERHINGRAGNGRHWPVLAVLFVAMLIGGFNYRCLTTALPSYLSGVGQETAAPAGEPDAGGTLHATASTPQRYSAGVVFLVLAVGGIGQFIGGSLGDRFRPALLYATMIGLTIPVALLLWHSQDTAVAGTAVLVLFLFAQQPLENMMVADATPVAWRSTAYGMKFILTFGIASIGAWVSGVVWERFGLTAVFGVFALGAACMLLVAASYDWLSRRPALRQEKTPPAAHVASR